MATDHPRQVAGQSPGQAQPDASYVEHPGAHYNAVSLIVEVFKTIFSAPLLAFIFLLAVFIGDVASNFIGVYLAESFFLPRLLGSLFFDPGESLFLLMVFSFTLLLLSTLFRLPSIALSQAIGATGSSLRFHGSIVKYVINILLLIIISLLSTFLVVVLQGVLVGLAADVSLDLTPSLQMFVALLIYIMWSQYLMMGTVLYFEGDVGVLGSAKRAREIIKRHPKNLHLQIIVFYALFFVAGFILFQIYADDFVLSVARSGGFDDVFPFTLAIPVWIVGTLAGLGTLVGTTKLYQRYRD